MKVTRTESHIFQMDKKSCPQPGGIFGHMPPVACYSRAVMLSGFFRPTAPVRDDRHELVARPGSELLAHHESLMAAIRSLVAVPPHHWRTLYLAMLENFAALVQLAPASETHHHAEPGGLLRHSLETVHEALLLRRGLLLPPGVSAESTAARADLWTYAVVSAALLHDAGKPVTDLRYVTLAEGKEKSWNPLGGPMPPGSRYRFRFDRRRVHGRHAAVAPLLAPLVIPATGLQWLASDPGLLALWVAALREESAGENVLADIVKRADRRSTAADLGNCVEEMDSRPPRTRFKPLAERLMSGLRQMLLDGILPLNAPGAAGFLDGDTLWLVSKRTLDTLRERLHETGVGGIPERNDRLMDELQQHGWLTPNGDRAVWRCEIRIGEWRQTLSCLRFPAERIWADASSRPEPMDGSVHIVEDPASQETRESDPACSEERGNGKDATSSREEDVEHSASLPPPPPPVRSDADAAGKEEGPESDRAASSTKDPGERFVAWLRTGIEEGRFLINTPQARLHVLVQGLALITPGIFMDYAPLEWYRVQKRFQKLRLHAKTPWDENIWTCRVAKDRKQSYIKVFLIPDPEASLRLSRKLPAPNPTVTLITGETDDDTSSSP